MTLIWPNWMNGTYNGPRAGQFIMYGPFSESGNYSSAHACNYAAPIKYDNCRYFLALPGPGVETWDFYVMADGCEGCSSPPINSIKDRNDGVRHLTAANCPIGMPQWEVSEPYISLWIRDQPLGFAPALGSPISFALGYKQRETVSGLDSAVFSVGKKWNCSWLSFISKDSDGSMLVLFPGGGQRNLTNNVDYLTRATVVGETNTGYTVFYPEGSRAIYGFLVTNTAGVFSKAFLSEQWDPEGHRTRFIYQPYDPVAPIVRLQSIIDADGRETIVQYSLDNLYSTNLITQVSDPFGRSCRLAYDWQGRLTNVIDTAGISSSFSYDANDCITNLATPYGLTSFSFTDTSGTNLIPNGRSILVSEPGGTHQLFAYWDSANGVPNTYPANEIPNDLPFTNTFETTELNFRNTFHWGRRQFEALSTTSISGMTAADFAKARMLHWLRESTNAVSETVSLRRDPSPDEAGTIQGQKTWFDYVDKPHTSMIGGQPSPMTVARVLPDGSSQFEWTERNVNGFPLKQVATYSSGPAVLLRTNSLSYATNNIDLTSITNAVGTQILRNIFNGYHQVVTNFNALAEPSIFTYNDNQQLTSVTTPSLLTITNIYAINGQDVNRLTATYEFSGNEVYRSNFLTYHGNGLVYSKTDERALTRYYFWDPLQRLVSTWYPDGSTASNFYTALDLTATKDRLDHWNSFDYDGLRRMTSAVNANGVVTRYGYCGCGSVAYQTNAWGTPVEQITMYGYDLQGNRTYAYLPDATITNWYDSLGRLSITGDGWGYRWFSYNNQGLLSTVSNSFGLEKSIVYDVLDRALYVTDANGVTITNVYDDLGRLRSRGYPDHGIEQFDYSPRGLTAYTNQIGAPTYYAYNVAGWKLFETNANYELIQFRYDSSGNLTNLIDGKNQSTLWAYDEYGRVKSKTDQDGLEIARYGYHLNGLLRWYWTAAKGTNWYTYDPVANLTHIDHPSSPDVVFQYDWLDRLTNMVDAIGTTKYTYTPGGQLWTEDGPFANDTITLTYLNRFRTALTLQQPTGTWTNGFGYDPAHRLTSVSSPAGTFVYNYSAGQTLLPGTLIRGISLPNTSYITNTFDAVSRLTGTFLKKNDQSILDAATYRYDLASQRMAYTDAQSAVYQYGYDPIGQLKVADSSVVGEDRGYSYDSAWNLNYLTNNGSLGVFTVNNKNQLTSALGANCTYDANGNLTASGNYSYVYDDENQLIQWFYFQYGPNAATNGDLRTDFFYDGKHRLRKRVEYVVSAPATNTPPPIDGPIGLHTGLELAISSPQAPQPPSWVLDSQTIYLYDGNRVIQERDGSNSPTVGYTRGLDLSGSFQGAGGIGGLLACSTLNTQPSSHAYYHSDGNGNVTFLVTSTQTTGARYRYDPFGNLISKSGALADANLYRFSSKELHAKSGMYYFLYRFYDPELQRWINRDPIGENGDKNLFRFVGNSPTGLSDPWGLLWYEDLATWAGQNINSAQDALAHHLGYLSVPLNNTLSAINMVAQTPNLIGNLGTATGTTGWYIDEPILQPLVNLGSGVGTWWGNPTLENGAAAAADVSTAAGILAGALKPLPSLNKPCLAAEGGGAQTFATGKEWYDYFAGKYGAQNVEWTSGSGRTLAWPSELPMPANTEMLRVPPGPRSSSFVSDLESVAGPRPVDAIAHHTQPLGLNGADNGLINGSWVDAAAHQTGHGAVNSVVNSVPYGTWIIIKP